MSFYKNGLNCIKMIPMLLVFGIICSCENDIEEVNLLTRQENKPLRKGKNVELTYSERATVKVKLIAAKMEEYAGEAPYVEMTEGVKVLFYDSLKRINSTLTAQYAINKEKEQIIEVKDNVVVVNRKGERLNTEHLIWQKDSSKIYSEEFVKITTPEEIITGEGFEANEDFTKWKINKIKGIILIEEQDL